MRLGTYLEQYAADRYAEKTGALVRNYGYMVTRGHALADVDRLVAPPGAKVASHHQEIRAAGILECKTARDDWDGEVPLHYQVQAQGYMELLDLPWCDFSVVFKASSRHLCPVDAPWLRIERDRAVGAKIMQEIEAFWRFVEEDDLPPATCLADAAALFPNAHVDTAVAATTEIAEIVDRLRLIKGQLDELSTEEDALRGRVASFMGVADTLLDKYGAKLCTYRNTKPRVITDWKAVAEELKADEKIVAAHTKEGAATRRFVLCKTK